MALNAKQLLAFALGRIPMAMTSTVRAGLPIAIDDSMALGAKLSRLIGGDLAPIVRDVGVAIGLVVAVQAIVVAAMIQHDVPVFGQTLVETPGCLKRPMAFRALVYKSRRHAATQPERPKLTSERAIIHLHSALGRHRIFFMYGEDDDDGQDQSQTHDEEKELER